MGHLVNIKIVEIQTQKHREECTNIGVEALKKNKKQKQKLQYVETKTFPFQINCQ